MKGRRLDIGDDPGWAPWYASFVTPLTPRTKGVVCWIELPKGFNGLYLVKLLLVRREADVHAYDWRASRAAKSVA